MIKRGLGRLGGLNDTVDDAAAVVAEQRVELPFLDDWEMRLDASIEGGKGNPEAVAVLKGQIRELRDSIAARRAREGKEYWSIYRIETFACHAIEARKFAGGRGSSTVTFPTFSQAWWWFTPYRASC